MATSAPSTAPACPPQPAFASVKEQYLDHSDTKADSNSGAAVVVQSGARKRHSAAGPGSRAELDKAKATAKSEQYASRLALRLNSHRAGHGAELCAHAALSAPCPFLAYPEGDRRRCGKSHDVGMFLRAAPPDLCAPVTPFECCPILEKYGWCPAGFCCRFGASHIIPCSDEFDGENEPSDGGGGGGSDGSGGGGGGDGTKIDTTYKLSYSIQSNPDGRDSDTNSAARLRTLNDYTPANLRRARRRRAARLSGADGEGRLAEALRLTELALLCTECGKMLPESSFSRRQLEGGANNVRKKARKANKTFLAHDDVLASSGTRRCIACVRSMKRRECKPEACLVCGKIFRSRTQLFAHIAEEGHEADDIEDAVSGAASPSSATPSARLDSSFEATVPNATLKSAPKPTLHRDLPHEVKCKPCEPNSQRSPDPKAKVKAKSKSAQPWVERYVNAALDDARDDMEGVKTVERSLDADGTTGSAVASCASAGDTPSKDRRLRLQKLHAEGLQQCANLRQQRGTSREHLPARLSEVESTLLQAYRLVWAKGTDISTQIPKDVDVTSLWRPLETAGTAADETELAAAQRDIDERLRKRRVAVTGGHGAATRTTGAALLPLPRSELRPVDLRGKVYIAPLTTVGNLPFRRICRQFGADVTCAEMALASSLLEGKAAEWALLRRHPDEAKLFGIQLAGSDARAIAGACDLLHAEAEVGRASFDFVDINLGCPIDALCARGGGAGLCWRPELERVVRSSAAVLSVPLSVKLRLGVVEDELLAPALLQRMRSWGAGTVAWATIHGRTRNQRYTRLADWNLVRGACAMAAGSPLRGTTYVPLWDSSASGHTVQAWHDARTTRPEQDLPPIPLIGNGDIMSHHDWWQHLEGVENGEKGEQQTQSAPPLLTNMLARGALIKPWICTEIKERRDWDISSSERFDMLKDFVRFGLENWGSDAHGVNITRRYLLEWLSFLHRYIPVGLLERLPQRLNEQPPRYIGRDELETLMSSPRCSDWVRISEMLLGPVESGFTFQPKHRSNAY